MTLGPESSQSQTASFLGRTPTLRQWRLEYEPDQQHVSRALKALGLTNAKCVPSLGTDDVGGSKASEISKLRRTAKWNDPPEEIREEEDRFIGEELKLLQRSGKIQCPCDGQARPFMLSKRTDAENGFTTHPRPHRPQQSCTIHSQIPPNDLQICME